MTKRLRPLGTICAYAAMIPLLLVCLTAKAQTPVSVGPEPQTQFLDQTGTPLAGGIVCTYQAGTSTPLATYTDSTGTVQNSNPVVLNSAGRANIWWQSQAYKVVLAGGGTCGSPSNLQWTVDNFQVGISLNGNNTWTGTNTFDGTTTFNGPANLTVGGSMNGTFTGNPNFSGSPTFTGTIVASQFQSIIATGTPPLIVASTTLVPNLNVEILDNCQITGTPAAGLAVIATNATTCAWSTLAPGGVTFPTNPALHTVPVITSTNTVTWTVVPDCQGNNGLGLTFTQSTNTFACGEIIGTTFKKGTGLGNYNTSSTSYTNVDATSMAYTVTIPTGANLVVTASGTWDSVAGPSTFFVAIADGGTPVGTQVYESSSAGTPAFIPYSFQTVIAGDGMSHPITLQFKEAGGSSSNATILNGSDTVPTMLFTLQ